MQKTEAPRSHAQSQPDARQAKGLSIESPQSERLAQFQAMADASPFIAAQRRLLGAIEKRPHVTNGDAVAQLVTRVTWTTQNFEYNNALNPAQIDGQMVGRKMEADLDPNDMRAGNAAGGVGMTALFGSLNANWNPGAMGWVRGHLLNDHLGGPNVDPNLFPITGHANHDHLTQVESHVKDWMRAGRSVRYEVTATQQGGNVGNLRNAAGDFHCYAYTTDAQQREVVNKTISSVPAPGNGNAGHAAATAVHANNWWYHNNTMAGGGNPGNHGLAGAAGALDNNGRAAWNAAHARRGWFRDYYEL